MGCRNHYCYLSGYNTGMCTNMICKCLDELPMSKRIQVQRRINSLEMAIKNLIEATENHHISPHDLPIRDKYNMVKSEAKKLVGMES